MFSSKIMIYAIFVIFIYFPPLILQYPKECDIINLSNSYGYLVVDRTLFSLVAVATFYFFIQCKTASFSILQSLPTLKPFNFPSFKARFIVNSLTCRNSANCLTVITSGRLSKPNLSLPFVSYYIKLSMFFIFHKSSFLAITHSANLLGERFVLFF